MLSDYDLFSRIREKDEQCKKRGGGCKGGKCLESSHGKCFSINKTSLDLRNRLRARKPTHPLLALFPAPDLTSEERRVKSEDLKRRDDRCKTARGCRQPYCVPRGAGCKNMSKAAEELRGLLGGVRAGASAASRGREAPRVVEDRRRLSRKTSLAELRQRRAASQPIEPSASVGSDVVRPRWRTGALRDVEARPTRKEPPEDESRDLPVSPDSRVARPARSSRSVKEMLEVGGARPSPSPPRRRSEQETLAERLASLRARMDQLREPSEAKMAEYVILLREKDREARRQPRSDLSWRGIIRDEFAQKREETRRSYEETLARLRALETGFTAPGVEPPGARLPVSPVPYERMSERDRSNLLETGYTTEAIDEREEQRLRDYLEAVRLYEEASRKARGLDQKPRPTARRTAPAPRPGADRPFFPGTGPTDAFSEFE